MPDDKFEVHYSFFKGKLLVLYEKIVVVSIYNIQF